MWVTHVVERDLLAAGFCFGTAVSQYTLVRMEVSYGCDMFLQYRSYAVRHYILELAVLSETLSRRTIISGLRQSA